MARLAELEWVSCVAIHDDNFTTGMSLGKKLFQGAGLNMVDHLIKIGALFISTPFMVRFLGQEGYGQWLLGMAILGYLSMLDLGMSLGVSRFLSTAIGARDDVQQAVILGISERYFHFIGWVVAVGGLAAGPLAVATLSGVVDGPGLMVGVSACGLSLALRFRYRMPGLLLRSHVRYDLLAAASIARVLLQTGLLCAALQHGGGLLAVGLLQAFGDLVELGLQVVLSRRLHPPRRNATGPRDPVMVARLRGDIVRYTRDSMLASLGDSVRVQAGPLILGSLKGPREVVTYSMGMRLIQTYMDFCTAAFGGNLLMALGQIHGSGDQERVRREFRRLIRVTAGFSAWAMGGIAFLGEPFLQRWLGHDFDASFQVVVILAVPVALWAMQSPAYQLISAMGCQHYLMRIACIGGLTNAAASIPAAYFFGVNGIAIVLGVELIIVCGILVPWIVTKRLGLNGFDYAKNIFNPSSKACIAPGLIVILLWKFRSPDYAVLAFCGISYTLAFVATAPWILFDKEGRVMLKKLVLRK